MNQNQYSLLIPFIDDTACRLLTLYCEEQPNETEINRWFSDIQFEELPSEYVSLAAVMSAPNNFSGVPQDIVPRLRGIIKHIHTLNLGMTVGLCALLTALNQKEISALLLGNTAIQYGTPNQNRIYMWQTELAVLEDHYQAALTCARAIGFSVEEHLFSATARRGSAQCVIIYKFPPNTYLFDQAEHFTVGGTSCLLPTNAARFVSLAEAAVRVLADNEPSVKLVSRLAALHNCLLSPMDWDNAEEIAQRNGVSNKVRFVIDMYNQITRNSIQSAVQNRFGSKKQTEALYRSILLRRKTYPKQKIKRLWLSAKIKAADKPSESIKNFSADLIQSAVKKITRKN